MVYEFCAFASGQHPSVDHMLPVAQHDTRRNDAMHGMMAITSAAARLPSRPPADAWRRDVTRVTPFGR